MLWFVVLLADGRIKSVSAIKTAEPQKKKTQAEKCNALQSEYAMRRRRQPEGTATRTKLHIIEFIHTCSREHTALHVADERTKWILG